MQDDNAKTSLNTEGDTPENRFQSYTNHFLIAMPNVQDEMFGKSVVYLCDHSERGALGLVINKTAEMSMPDLFQKIDLSLTREDLRKSPVFQGGPVHRERGFVLHDRMITIDTEVEDTANADAATASTELLNEAQVLSIEHALENAIEGVTRFDKMSAYASTLFISGDLEVTTSKDVLEALSGGAGPKRVMVSLGYSSWEAGQLESEIAENAWLTVPADTALIFETPINERYSKALGLLGVSELALSALSGHA